MASASLADSDENLYEVLGLDGSQEPPLSADIRKAYRRRALECHPDKRPGDKAAGESESYSSSRTNVLSEMRQRFEVQRQR